MNRWKSVAKGLFGIFLITLLAVGSVATQSAAAAGKGRADKSAIVKPNKSEKSKAANKLSGALAEASPPPVIQELRKSLDDYQPQVAILSPKANETLTDDTVSVRFQVKDLPIFKNEKLGLGPHLHVLLDNHTYRAVYDTATPLVFENLEPGTHTIRAFASRPWHESFKNEGAYAQVSFHVFTKTQENNPNPDLPLLTYSRPQGSYGAEPIMLDFYLTNAPLHLVAQEDDKDDIVDWRIRCTVNGESFILDRWQPIYLKGFKPGKNWVQLEFLDEKGNPVSNAFNNTARTISYEPNGKDTLSRLVRGELSISEARGIVDPNYIPTAPTPVPSPTSSPSPSPTPPPGVELIPSPSPVVPPVRPTPTSSPAAKSKPASTTKASPTSSPKPKSIKPSPSPALPSPTVSPSPDAVKETPKPLESPEPLEKREAPKAPESGLPKSSLSEPKKSKDESGVRGFLNRFRPSPKPTPSSKAARPIPTPSATPALPSPTVSPSSDAVKETPNSLESPEPLEKREAPKAPETGLPKSSLSEPKKPKEELGTSKPEKSEEESGVRGFLNRFRPSSKPTPSPKAVRLLPSPTAPATPAPAEKDGSAQPSPTASFKASEKSKSPQTSPTAVEAPKPQPFKTPEPIATPSEAPPKPVPQPSPKSVVPTPKPTPPLLNRLRPSPSPTVSAPSAEPAKAIAPTKPPSTPLTPSSQTLPSPSPSTQKLAPPVQSDRVETEKKLPETNQATPTSPNSERKPTASDFYERLRRATAKPTGSPSPNALPETLSAPSSTSSAEPLQTK